MNGARAARIRRTGRMALVSAVALLGAPHAALAAFELRDASPSALGGASLDLPADALDWGPPAGDPGGPARGLWIAASHADLYGAAGLGFDRVAAGRRGERLDLAISYARTGGAGAGATESTVRLEARERGDRAIAIGGSIERLAFGVDGEPEAVGWAASVAAHARLVRDRVLGEFTVVADRIARSPALDRLGAGASLAFTARAASGPVALAYVDRAGSERGSPRLVADLALGGGASLRASRGRSPGRFGVALAVRWRAIAVSAGRLDDAGGGVVSAAEVRLGTAKRSRRARFRRCRRGRGRTAGTAVPLLARNPSAIMRRHGTIRERRAGFASRAGAILLALACAGTVAVPALADQSGAWLPLPPDEIESPDRVAVPALHGDAAIGADVVGGRWTAARFIARARARSIAATAARIEPRDDGPGRQTMLLAALGDRIRIGAGRVVVRDAPVLFGETAGFSRRLRRPLEARSRAPEWDAPRSASSLGVDGASLAVEFARGPRRGAAWAAWALGGRGSEDGEPIRAAGFARRAARWKMAASAARRFGSVAGEWRGRAGVVAVEALVSRGRGPSFLASATAESTGSPLRFVGRWRRRSDERRPVAAEFVTEAGTGRAGTLRLAWRPWSASGSPFADDGAVELDARWRSAGMPGPARLRLGRRGGEGTTAARAFAGEAVGESGGAAAIPERYAVLDLPLAGERGRLVSLLASRRERGRPGARAIGTTVGARTRLGWRGRASVIAQVDAARTRGSAAFGGAAWSSAIAASGDETLAARGTGGVYVTVSGWLRAGPVVLRVHARDGEDGRGGRPLQATIWMEWSGSAMRSRPPGDAGSGG